MKALKFLMPFVLFALASCTEKGAQTDLNFFNDQVLYCKTVKKLNDVVLQNGFPPMIASRNYVYANIAAFECVAAGDDNYISLAGQIKHMPAMPKPATKEIDFSLAALFAFIKVGNSVTFPEGSMMGYYAELKNMADSIGMPETILKNTIAFSDTISTSVINWSKKDNYSKTRTAERYSVSYKEPGRWIPTPPGYTPAVEPHWNEVRTMVMDSASQFRPVAPPVFDTINKNGEYFKALMEVKTVGENLTPEQKHIAEFWDDNPSKQNIIGHVSFITKKFSPPGHWMNIVGIGAKTAKADFKTTVAAYAETAIALYEGFISCWDEKFRSNYVRPETEINKIDDNWHPYIQTPPFPSYTSGHATISAAAAEIMTKWFGDNLSFTDTSLLEFGIKNRDIKSFRGAAEEAAMSRLYGGIHYRFDNENGAVAGKRLGEFIASRLKLYKGNLTAKK